VIDTHAHLDALEEPDAALARARTAGVSRVISIGTGLDSARATLVLARGRDDVYAVLGIDPHHAASHDAGRVDELRALLDDPKAVAVGETGLDGFHRHAPLEDQRRLFGAQLALADELGLPVVVHTREAVSETEEMLARFDGTVVLHCFSEPDLLPLALERGYYVSFAGNVTYPKAVELRAAAAAIPADRILAETDSPYLAPQPVRGQRNEPANVLLTLEVLADTRGVAPHELEAQIDENAGRAFGLSDRV
jgi:TatD DNase family protein